MAEHLDRKQGATDWTNHSVDGVPDWIHPWNLIGEKFEEIENTSDADDPGIAEDFQWLILRPESDPVKMDCEASGKNGEVKINACKRGETQRDAEEIQSFHAQTSGANQSKSRASLAKGPMTKHEWAMTKE